MSSFELKELLSQADIDKLAKIEAIDSGKRTTADASWLDARDPYRVNRVIRYDTDIQTTSQQGRDRTQDILEAEGNTPPHGYTGFKVGAIFYDLDDTGAVAYRNTGTNTSAVWTLIAGSDISSSPSISVSASISLSPSASDSLSSSL